MDSNQSIVHISITDMVANKLREGIKDGTFKSNQKLIETDLCKIMEVSRTPIRKAFEVLVEEGLLERIQGYGVVVAYKDIKLNYYVEILEVLEQFALERAIDNITENEISELKKIQKNMEELWNTEKKLITINSESWKAFSIYDIKFHNTLVKASGNPLIDEYIDLICKKAEITSYVNNITDKDLEDHRLILEAVGEKNLQVVGNTMKCHMDCLLNT
ncbi:GntR family transcriptional regulator [Anaerocolumna sp. MB42-C2]|uniref:GntR family transcriptional regulator n=1 Tax=Anaerocolumna sp. MB42-C2 TaxID=3070997 RepID=UPI0027E18BAA|nr:GntR family transcriptional regulator [Anaerocolumna sp. MB42-C2]WMJ88929.1 GntR family transcriptional regulator [Anaerocolumna sp. MB42-C2]